MARDDTIEPLRSSFLGSINRRAVLFYKTKPRDFDLSLPHTKTSGADIGTGDGEAKGGDRKRVVSK